MLLTLKIRLSVLAPLLLGILVLVITTCSFAGLLNKYAGHIARDQIVQDVQDVIYEISITKSSVVNEFVKDFAMENYVLFYFANEYFNGGFSANPLPSYNGLSYLSAPLPGGLTTDSYDRLSNYGASAWWDNDVTTLQEFQNMDQTFVSEINMTSLMDIPFASVTLSNPEIVYTQMGINRTGFFRIYPYINLDSYLDRHDLCLSTNQYDYGYDPRCRPWFIDALQSPNEIIFTTPYTSSLTNGAVIAAAKHLTFPNGAAVVSTNTELGTLRESILSTKVMDNGYAYVIDWQENMILHPEFTEIKEDEDNKILQYEFDGNVDDYNDFSSILSEMKQGKQGDSTFYKKNKLWYISYSPVPSGLYTLSIVVPDTDVQTIIHSFQNKLVVLLAVQIIIFLIIIGIAVAVFYRSTFYFSRAIVEPIKTLTTVCDNISKGDLDKDIDNRYSSCKEVSKITTTFGTLLNALRFGNEDYYKGDKSKALRNYELALKMFTELKNEKGLGICHNNIANVKRYFKEPIPSEMHYLKAIEFAMKLNDPPSIQGKNIIAQRKNNLAMLYIYSSNTQNDIAAEKILLQVIEIDRENLDATSLINHMGNLVVLFMKMGRIDEAELLMNEIRQIPFQPFADQEKSLALVTKLEDHYNSVRLNPTVISGKMHEPKDVYFLLDYSGSMSGPKNSASIGGMTNIFEKQIYSGDRLCFIRFNEKSQTVIPLTPKENNEKAIFNDIKKSIEPSGGTAFYDALGDAFVYIINRQAKVNQWIISLTDGEDNKSGRFSVGALKDMASKNPEINLVIITVGEVQNKSELESICKVTRNGILLDISDQSHAILAAFDKVAALMEAQVEKYDFQYDM